jgi:hypothetical protein
VICDFDSSEKVRNVVFVADLVVGISHAQHVLILEKIVPGVNAAHAVVAFLVRHPGMVGSTDALARLGVGDKTDAVCTYEITARIIISGVTDGMVHPCKLCRDLN